MPTTVAEVIDMGNGALGHEEVGPDAVDARAAPADAVRASSPSYLRVASTVIADAVALIAAAALAGWIGDPLGDFPVIHQLFAGFAAEPQGGTIAFLCMTPYWLAALWAFGLYREPGRSIGGMNLTDTLAGLTALTSASWLLLMVLVFFQGTEAPVAVLIMFWALAALLVPLCRWVARLTVWSREIFQERVLIIGAGQVGHTLAGKISRHPEYRVKLVGFLEDGEPRSRDAGGPPMRILGPLTDLKQIVTEERIDRVIVAFSKARHNDFLSVVRACDDSGVRVNIVPRLFEVVSSRALVDDIEGIPLLDIAHAELSRFNMAAKRVFDLIVGGAFFVVALIPIAVIAVIIKLDSPGPVFFRQERMGRGGTPFRMFKFRSMYVGAEKLRLDLAAQNEYDGPMFKMKVDPRVTRVGKWLRQWSLDEVPQIINVLKGEMSLVGPRPLWIHEAKQCRGWTRRRLDITPGITGLWQVLGRSDIPFDEMVKLDYMYVTGWSLSWDIKLLFQTVPAVMDKRGAY